MRYRFQRRQAIRAWHPPSGCCRPRGDGRGNLLNGPLERVQIRPAGARCLLETRQARGQVGEGGRDVAQRLDHRRVISGARLIAVARRRRRVVRTCTGCGHPEVVLSCDRDEHLIIDQNTFHVVLHAPRAAAHETERPHVPVAFERDGISGQRPTRAGPFCAPPSIRKSEHDLLDNLHHPRTPVIVGPVGERQPGFELFGNRDDPRIEFHVNTPHGTGASGLTAESVADD